VAAIQWGPAGSADFWEWGSAVLQQTLPKVSCTILTPPPLFAQIVMYDRSNYVFLQPNLSTSGDFLRIPVHFCLGLQDTYSFILLFYYLLFPSLRPPLHLDPPLFKPLRRLCGQTDDTA